MIKKAPVFTLITLLIALGSCQFIQSVTHTGKNDQPQSQAENRNNSHQKRHSKNEPLDKNTVITDEDVAILEDTDTISDPIMVESVMYDDSLMLYSNRLFNKPENVHQLTSETPLIEMLDSLVNIRFFNTDYFITDTQQLNVYNYSRDQIPTFPDSVYEQRIARLDQRTPFDLTYNNTVKGFIELYSVRKRNLTSRIMGLSEIYFPMFEEMLDKYNIPLEMKYLAVVESALHPQAGSRAGAKGLWQFMYGTGKVYGLEVNSYVDDRFDVFKSTIAACEHLTDLYDIYQDWYLVLAAYNSGAGNVNKAIRRAGGVKNYWAIWPYLPRETRGYVPAFIAVYYVMSYPAEHNLYPVHPGILYNEIDTVMINRTLAFDQISESLKIPTDEIEFLNPSFKLGVIPASHENEYVLRLPRRYAGEFVSNQDSVYNFKTKRGIEQEKLITQVEKAKELDVHIVRKGENLAGIAKKHHTSVENIKSLNGLKSNMIHPGQKLSVYGSPKTTKSSSSSKSETAGSTIKRSDEQSSHTVKKGENLGEIAKNYHCSSTDIQNWNNLKSNLIFPGQKLIVYKPADENETVTAVEKTSSGSVKYVYHIVKQGDTLWDIAKQYDGVTVNQIKQLNQLSNAHKLKIGQKLKVAIVG